MDDEGYYFIDQDYHSFQPVLEYLRTGRWHLREASYEQVPGRAEDTSEGPWGTAQGTRGTT